MANNEEVAGLVVKLAMEDGSFQDGIQNLNRQMKLVDSEFKAAIGNTKNFGNSLDGLKANADKLSSAIEIQAQLITKHQEKLNNSKDTLDRNIQSQEQLKLKLDEVKKSYEDSVNSIGKNSDQSKALKEELDKLQKSYDDNNQKIRNNIKTIDNQTITINEANGKLKSMKIELENTTSAVDKFGKEVKNSDDGVSRSTIGLGAMNVAFGTLVADGIRRAISALGDFIKSGLNLNSNLQEVENVIDAVFGVKGTVKIEEFASTAKEQFGLAELQVKQFTGTMGSMLDSAGIASNKALDMSVNFTKLSGDMASFFNSTPEKAFQDLTSAMAGSSETMLKYGINMNIANLEQYAMNQGIRESWQEMSQAEQQMLRYNYIMDKTSKAQGDFVKTGEGHANQQRNLKLELQELSATMAEKLLPVVTELTAKLVNFLQDNTSSFENLANVIGVLGSAVAVLFTVLSKIPPSVIVIFTMLTTGIALFNTISNAITATTGTIGAVSKAFTEGTNPVLKWTMIIVGAVTAVTLLVTALNVLFGKTNDMERAMSSIGNSVGNVTGQINGSMNQFKVPQYAIGTQFHQGGLALVGERGSELVNLPRGTSVANTESTQESLGKQGITHNYNFPNGIVVQATDFQEFIDSMTQAVISGELVF